MVLDSLDDFFDGTESDKDSTFDGPSKNVRLATIVLLSMISISGAVGNLLVFLIVWFERKLQIVSSIFIINISVVGFLFSTLSIPFHIYHLVNHKHYLQTEGAVCRSFGYLNFLFLLATLVSSCAIAVNRYIVVTKPKTTYLRQYTVRRVIIWIVMLWVLPAALAACGIPYYGYHSKVMGCSLLSTPDAYWFTCVLIGGPAAGTFMVILSLYYSIFKTVRNSRRRIKGLSTNPGQNLQVSSICKSVSSTVGSKHDSTQHTGRTMSTSGAEAHEVQNTTPGVTVNSGDSIITLTHGDEPHSSHTANASQKTSNKNKQIEESHVQYSDGKICLTSRTAKSTGHGTSWNTPSHSETGNSNIQIIKRQAKVPMELFYTDGKSSVATELPPLHDDRISHIRSQRRRSFDNEKRSIAIKTDTRSKTVHLTDERSSKSRRRDEDSDKPIVIINTKSTVIQYEIKLTFHLFIVFAVYCALFLPMCFTYLIQKWQPITPDAWMIVQILSSSYFALAWILYGLINRQFRRAYLKILKCERLREHCMRSAIL